MTNPKWKIENDKWKMENGELILLLLPTNASQA
jgi:hypothetical protein